MPDTARARRPSADEHAPFYATYIALVPDGDILATLSGQLDGTLGMLRTLPESAGGRRYAEGKWSVREVLGHLSDSERVFSYRALRFARGDETPLPGFDEKAFASNGNADRQTISSLCDEFAAVRAATLPLFGSLRPDDWSRIGTANANAMSVRALAWVCAGHELHHRAILKTRYL